MNPRTTILATLLLALAVACAAPPRVPAPRAPAARAARAIAAFRERDKLRALAQQVLDLHESARELRPSEEHRLETLARSAVRRSIDLRERLDREVEEKRLDAGGRVDLALARLFLDRIDRDVAGVLEREAAIRELLPSKPAIESLDPRKRYLTPGELAAGLEALETIGRTLLPWSIRTRPGYEEARDRARSGIDRIRRWADLARSQSPEESDRLASLADRAVARLETHLAETAPPEDEEERATIWPEPVGREEFVWRLRHRHLVTATPEQIAERGRRLLDETDRRMEDLVSRLYPGKTVAEALEALKDEAPTAEELPVIARRAMEEARDFVVEKGLVTVPEDLREGIVAPVSDALARTFPFGAYAGTSSVAGRPVGVYLVSPGAAWMTDAERKARLRGNDPFKTRVVALHEMWPGHHLQRGYQNRNPNLLRRRFYTSTYGEGWALYAEELLFRHGFYRDLRTRLAQLAMRRWRCARVILDPSLHLGWMTPEEGVDLLIDRVGLERTNAEAEVRRYLGNATRPFSYIWGWLDIEVLRRDCLARGMTEREFHDRLLEAGPIPLPLVRLLLLGD